MLFKNQLGGVELNENVLYLDGNQKFYHKYFIFNIESLASLLTLDKFSLKEMNPRFLASDFGFRCYLSQVNITKIAKT